MSDPLPPQWDRLARRGMGSMVRAEAEALRVLRAASSGVTRALAAELAGIPPGYDRRRASELAIQQIHGALAPMREAVARAVTAGRLNAKTSALVQFDAEWEAVRSQIQALGMEDPGRVNAPPHASADAVAGALAGQSYAAAWGQSAVAAVNAWQAAESGSVATTARAASSRVEHKLRTIAATETVQATCDARESARVEVAKVHRERRWYGALAKYWDARLDRRACDTCYHLGGAVRPWGIPFPRGNRPGYVHPGCRCFEASVLLPALIERERSAA